MSSSMVSAACMSAVCENVQKGDFFGLSKYNCKVGVQNKKKMRCVLTSNSCLVNNGFCSVYGLRSGHPGCWKRKFSGSAQQGGIRATAVPPVMEGTSKKKQPPTKERRVVVTGMGVITPNGHDPNVFYENLLQGVSGISEIESFDCSQFPTRIAGEIKSFSIDGWIEPKLSKRMDKLMLYIITAGKKALLDGGITDDIMKELNKARCGVLIGSGLGGVKIFSDLVESLMSSSEKMNDFCIPYATTNTGSAMLAIDLG